MTDNEAYKIVRAFDENRLTSDDDIFMFTEAMNYLIDKHHNPKDMLYLGGYYYEQKNFDLALKYYEMAASYDFDPAYECLGYIWYYGRTGTRDYKKAFEYFSKLMAKGDLVASYKVADMYKNGYFVEKSYDKYVEIVESLYPKVIKCHDVFDPIPEVFTRLARIRKGQENYNEAIDLYLKAKRVLAIRIKYNAFFGNLNIMKWLVEDLYTMIEFDEVDFDLFDLYFLLTTPHEISFYYDDIMHNIKSEAEGNECHICFDGTWYRTIDDFFAKAMIDNQKLTNLNEELYDFEVVR